VAKIETSKTNKSKKAAMCKMAFLVEMHGKKG
jgi:hypothetical protein